MKTFFQICVIITLMLVVFTLCVNFVDGLGIFPVNVPAGFQVGSGTNSSFSNLTDVRDPVTGLSGGMDALWKVCLTLSGIGAVVLGLFFHSTIPLAIYLFGAVFWTSYIRSFSVLSLNNYLPESFILIGTVLMMFVFAGAIIGMFGGSG